MKMEWPGGTPRTLREEILKEYWDRNTKVDEAYDMGLITASERDADHALLADEERLVLALEAAS